MAGIPKPRDGADRLALLVATGLGSGYSPYGPGTCGTIVAIPLYLALHPTGPVVYLIACVLLVLVGVVVSNRVIDLTGGKDPQLVVVDEILGFMITMALIQPTIVAVILGFALFRVFDIFKPNLIRRMERLNGGWGVMMDDFMAGIYANMALRALLWIFEPP